ncbi:MAG: V-type ATP synthase subunit F [Candidatus Nanohaloarchaeota archaeon QJJ-5]|nr:V-type ATP synthase subunit F [Candidatus Nanohaloarchaeota archaeon QJJ-5]
MIPIDNDKLKDIAVIGDQQLCLGFQLAGVTETYDIDDDDESFENRLDTLMEQDYGILITKHDYLAQLPKKKRLDVQNSVEPVVVTLSDSGESGDLRAKIKQAIGVDIWD